MQRRGMKSWHRILKSLLALVGRLPPIRQRSRQDPNWTAPGASMNASRFNGVPPAGPPPALPLDDDEAAS